MSSDGDHREGGQVDRLDAEEQRAQEPRQQAAPSSPSATPGSTSAKPCRITSALTCPGDAPSAMPDPELTRPGSPR